MFVSLSHGRYIQIDILYLHFCLFANGKPKSLFLGIMQENNESKDDTCCNKCQKVCSLTPLPPEKPGAKRFKIDRTKHWSECNQCNKKQVCAECVFVCDECDEKFCGDVCLSEHLYCGDNVNAICTVCDVTKELPIFSLKCGMDVPEDDEQQFWRECSICKTKTCENCYFKIDCQQRYTGFCNSCFPSKLSRESLEQVTLKLLKSKRFHSDQAVKHKLALKKFKKQIADQLLSI
jgi:hypothetical protein